ncbi:Ecm9p SKDI_11G2160 [Saccharomyces kudriavzevii IFO 1802]|uniref:ECM9-like protein n=1 Tax=Saccharomyces kudriavzevii (strain ATCC MYA-4449 / AS 2.2408 / CBS 8840 / NBRC 1802 / NCYC 2889) TaxID=226230 RepID=A0AA35J156_SACK1|nr:uncharacterized protein SKDI_11G2160 [Saccharomyces kudriavzevii IFO 1802]CAI4045059.1 hypothetical protein SKDI_11G2160 [Saccharomyces kudriavzevii IFO 1802]
MKLNLPLCKEFFEKITTHLEHDNFKLTVARDQPSIALPYYLDKNAHHIELVTFKSTFLSLFQESHTYFNGTLSDQKLNYVFDENIYFMTIGLLLTTPENKTIHNIHEQLLRKYFQDNSILSIPNLFVKEVRLVQRLLCSSSNRINKSSSLWILYRKLYVLSLGAKTPVFPDFCFLFNSSASQHFSNYYCWNTARWFYDNSTFDKKKELFDLTKRFCFQHIKDCSSWSTLAYMVCQQKLKNVYNIHDFQRLTSSFDLQIKPNKADLDFQIPGADVFPRELVEWIDNTYVADWPPYLCFLQITELNLYPGISIDSVLSTWKTQVQIFEEKCGCIKLKNNAPVVPEQFTSDLLISVNFVHFGYKKLLNILFDKNKTKKNN